MTPVLANRSFRLRRLARVGALLRAVAWLLAVSLAVGGQAAAAMPLHGVAAPAPQAADREDCGHGRAAADAKAYRQASGDCCRTTCACALGHAIGEVPALACGSWMQVAVSLPPARDAGLGGARAAPPLRPPIV